MINLDREESIFLVEDALIPLKLADALDKVIEFYSANTLPVLGTYRGASSIQLALRIFDAFGSDFVRYSSKSYVELLIKSSFRGAGTSVYLSILGVLEADFGEVEVKRRLSLQSNSELSKFEGKRAVNDFFKVVLIQMWSDGCIILPLSVSMPYSSSKLLFDYIDSLNNPILKRVWSLHPSCTYPNAPLLDDKKNTNPASHWCRLLLNTSFLDVSNISEDDIRSLLGLAGKSFYGRYYIRTFLHQICELSDTKRSILIRVSLELSKAKDEKKKLVDEKKKLAEERRRDREKHPRTKQKVERLFVNRIEYLKYRDTDRVQDLHIKCLLQNIALDYAEGHANLSFKKLVNKFTRGNLFKRMFYLYDQDAKSHDLYGQLPHKVQAFVELIWLSTQSWRSSKRNQMESDSNYVTNIMLLYVSLYLPRFYMDRDGNLDQYPSCFNEFECGMYFSRDDYIAKLISSNQELPKTVFDLLSTKATNDNWVNDTHYARAIQIKLFVEYIEQNSAIIPDAANFKATINSTDMPLTSKKYSTIKKFIPRIYFKALVSLLESLDYLVDHINGIADGENFVRHNGSLQKISHHKLSEEKEFRGLWGKSGGYKSYVDLALLNYSPIIFFEGKCYPLEKIRRYFKPTAYVVGGKRETRLTPHGARVPLLMCNTGIRQKHILWLNKDTFDSAIPEVTNAPLQPLVVNTDKSHSEWVAIVSNDVIKLCEKQRHWYEKNELNEFSQDIWYGHKPGAKFGKFKPLFRLETLEATWNILTEFPKILLTLQYFIKEQLMDTTTPDLVHWVPTKDALFSGDPEDHALTHAQYILNKHDSTWEWRLGSIYTPHGLRSAFVSEAIKFLPPSLIGRHLTGQTEKLVWYYAMLDEMEGEDHQQLLLNLLLKNHDRVGQGLASEVTEKIAAMNRNLANQINVDPSKAIDSFGLVSLAGVTEKKCGIEILRAKKYSQLAFNFTHICPFNNTCPKEVVEQYGLMKPCALCPYAIRGSFHLSAVNAEKLKSEELMKEYAGKINRYKKLPKSAQIADELTSLESQFDRMSIETAAYEAIEAQLYELHNNKSNDLVVQKKEQLLGFFAATSGNKYDYMLKRLCDSQIFPEFTSKSMQRKFALFRTKLVMASGGEINLDYDEDDEEHTMIASLIKSLMHVHKLSVKQVFKLASQPQKITDLSNRLSEEMGIGNLKKVSK